MKKCTLLICFVIFCLAGCKTNDIQNESLEKVEENTNQESVNNSKISEAYKRYCVEKNITIQNFSPCGDLDSFFEKSSMKDIKKVSITEVKVCKILNDEIKDVVIHMYVENELYSYTYIIPFVYSEDGFQLNEKAVIICTKLLNYTLVDIDGDAQNEILAEYILTHNGTDHIIQILKCDTSNGGGEIFYKSVDEFTHELKYGFTEEIPKKIWLQDTKTYINQDKKKKVAKKTKYKYVLTEGKYQIKKKKTDKKSDMKDFYEWALG